MFLCTYMYNSMVVPLLMCMYPMLNVPLQMCLYPMFNVPLQTCLYPMFNVPLQMCLYPMFKVPLQMCLYPMFNLPIQICLYLMFDVPVYVHVQQHGCYLDFGDLSTNGVFHQLLPQQILVYTIICDEISIFLFTICCVNLNIKYP